MVTDLEGNVITQPEFNAYGEKIGEKIVETGEQIPSLNPEGGGNSRILSLGGGANVPRTSISEANSRKRSGDEEVLKPKSNPLYLKSPHLNPLRLSAPHLNFPLRLNSPNLKPPLLAIQFLRQIQAQGRG